jgi:hypothetical protein
LFNAAPVVTAPSALESKLLGLDPDALSPREAQDVLYQLKAMTKEQA